MMDHFAVLPTAVGTVVGGLISAATTAFIQRREFGMRRKTEYLNQVVGAYDDLSEALRRYNRDCIRIMGYDMDHEDPVKVYLECQTAFLDLQYEFEKPLFRSDEKLQGMLERLRVLNVEMSDEVMYRTGIRDEAKVKGGLMKDLTALKDEMNDYLWEMKRRMILGEEEDPIWNASVHRPEGGSSHDTSQNGDVRNRGPRPQE